MAEQSSESRYVARRTSPNVVAGCMPATKIKKYFACFLGKRKRFIDKTPDSILYKTMNRIL